MPYITEAQKARLEWENSAYMPFPRTPGELNYCITLLCLKYVERKGKNYTHLNDVLGVLPAVQAEFYRRVVAPYEDEKRAENGDVF